MDSPKRPAAATLCWRGLSWRSCSRYGTRYSGRLQHWGTPNKKNPGPLPDPGSESRNWEAQSRLATETSPPLCDRSHSVDLGI